MADYGFRVYGDSGSIQFSNNIKNLCLAEKGPSTSWTPFASLYSNLRRWDITYTATGSSQPMIAISPTGGLVTPFGRAVSGGAYTWSFISGGDVSSLQYYIFDEIGIVTGGYGIAVYSDDQSLSYHSSRLPMRIAMPLITSDMGFRTWSDGGLIGPIPETLEYTPGRTYAAIIGTVANFRAYNYAGFEYALASNSVAVRIAGSSIIASGIWTTRESATVSTPILSREVYNRRRTIIIIDVTHY